MCISKTSLHTAAAAAADDDDNDEGAPGGGLARHSNIVMNARF